MNTTSKKSKLFLAAALLAAPAWTVSAQTINEQDSINVYGALPADISTLPEGPEVEGMISARRGDQMQVTAEDGTSTMVRIASSTEVRSSGGFLGLSKTALGPDSLLNGLPVTVKTVQFGDGLIASHVRFSNKNLETASMIRGGTAQRFAEHDVAIQDNAAATEALRGRVGDIDQYNIKATTNVNFDTGRWNLTSAAQNELCALAQQADAMDNALLLVVGYTDATGSQDYNQILSERRAGRVVNYLQQECGWEPWRMLTPTGMAEADPLADNETPAGMAQNRRVAVNILVSKAVDGI